LALAPKVLVEPVEAEPEIHPEAAELLPDPLLTLAESVRAEQTAGAAVEPAAEVIAEPPAIELVPTIAPVPEPTAPAEQPRAAALPEPQLAITEPAAQVALLAAPESEPIPAVTSPTEVAALPPEVAALPRELAAEPPVIAALPQEPVAPAPLKDVSQMERPKPQAPAIAAATIEVAPEASSFQTHRPLSASFAPGLPVGAYVDCASVLARSIRAARPSGKPCKPDTSPRMTLPGPTLPPGLKTFNGAGLIALPAVETSKGKSKSKSSSWLVSVTVMLVLLFMGVTAISSLTPHSAADTKPTSPVVAEPAPADSVPAPSHPLAKSIEVTGFRIVVDPSRKSEIHYLLVNHSNAPLDDVTVFVTLRAGSGKAGQAPLCRFSFRASGIGAFESKEMVSAIEKPTRTIALPEWQDLRADVQVGQ
jgi:hypothetical protein